MADKRATFWSVPSAEMLTELSSSDGGLSDAEARRRLKRYGANLLKPKKRHDTLTLFLSQFRSPIIIILLFAAILSFFLSGKSDATIILVIVLVSGILGFWQEKGAADAVDKLLEIVQVKATVVRGGMQKDVPMESVVPGDVVVLSAGDTVPGDCLLLESKDIFVDEAALTGESYPVEKMSGTVDAKAQISKRSNSLFLGTHVINGTARALVINTGKRTEFGEISEQLGLKAPETEFERGVRKFGYLLMEVTLILVLAIFAINVFLARPVLDSFLFAVALAVGLAPSLLPAIITINLARGAKEMAKKKVIVKKLASIENFGSMNILCADKTGTLTEGKVTVNSAVDVAGKEREKTLLYAYLNSSFQSSFKNPIDEAIRGHRKIDISGYKKLDEVPYDFIRKKLSILVSKGREKTIITKGPLRKILAISSYAESPNGKTVEMKTAREQIMKNFEELSNNGFRVLGVAYKPTKKDAISKEDEKEMVFLGSIVLFDPLKKYIVETVNKLHDQGIALKVITGDDKLVAANVGKRVGLATSKILTGPEIAEMTDDALVKEVADVDLFAEVEPNHKERIILALKKSGNVVGFLGDGINDASALHAADVGMSVDSAVDVAKEAADIVLLKKDLGVLVDGVSEGRKTFSNTLKYVFMATSANFGNMFSMAGASLFLSFLPLLPKQILLMNLITDFPEMAIATDSVDKELTEVPRRWNTKFIRNFMIVFGLISSIFDYVTFGVLLWLLHASVDQFRTGWFVESVVSAATIVLVVRTRKVFFKSKPGKSLFLMTLLVLLAAFVLPYTILDEFFGFTQLPLYFMVAVVVIVVMYVLLAEIAKKIFYHFVRF